MRSSRRTGVPWTFAVAAMAALSCVKPALVSATPDQEPVLLVARALLVDSSDASREWAREELGCRVCEVVTTALPSGEVLTYAINREQAVRIARAEITHVRLEEREGSFLVVVDLSAPSEQKILESSSPSAESANFVDGQFVDISSMRVVKSTYLVGVLPDLTEAERIARKLGWRGR